MKRKSLILTQKDIKTINSYTQKSLSDCLNEIANATVPMWNESQISDDPLIKKNQENLQ